MKRLNKTIDLGTFSNNTSNTPLKFHFCLAEIEPDHAFSHPGCHFFQILEKTK